MTQLGKESKIKIRIFNKQSTQLLIEQKYSKLDLRHLKHFGSDHTFLDFSYQTIKILISEGKLAIFLLNDMIFFKRYFGKQ